ncbi:MAG: ABC transporter permease [Paludibacteraceae bacterium]|nr:ABC transporter permease [Paludibacteraceae bacterium]
MNLPLYIAKRYLFSKKSHNAINIISIISASGVAVGTLALVCVLSVFNGFQGLIEDLFGKFDPQLQITVNEGKSFDPQIPSIQSLYTMTEIALISEVVQDNALLIFSDKQTPAVVKGVSDTYSRVNEIDDIILDGDFKLSDGVFDLGVAGVGLAQTLGCGVRFVEPVQLFAPKRNERINLARPDNAFTSEFIFLSGIFMVQQAKYDTNLLFVNIPLARKLFGYDKEVTSLELKLVEGVNELQVQKKVQAMLGEGFSVKNKYEQQAEFFKMMEVEKWITYLILSFIVLIAIFNVVGSLSMLIIDKKADIQILRHLGANKTLIFRIFLLEGWLISNIGVLVGVVLGLFVCWIQIQFGVLSLHGTDGAYIVEAYPVLIKWVDIAIITITVSALGFIAAIYPAYMLTKSTQE